VGYNVVTDNTGISYIHTFYFAQKAFD